MCSRNTSRAPAADGNTGPRTTNEAPVRPRPRTRTEHPQAAVTSRVAASLAVGCTALLLALTACTAPSSTSSDRKNGDTPPPARARTQAETASAPVPRGTGSRVPYDFNGDGHRDLVVNDLVKAPEDSHGDGDDDLVAATRPHAPGQAGKGTLLLGSAKGPAGPGSTYAFAAEDVPTAPLKTTGTPAPPS